MVSTPQCIPTSNVISSRPWEAPLWQALKIQTGFKLFANGHLAHHISYGFHSTITRHIRSSSLLFFCWSSIGGPKTTALDRESYIKVHGYLWSVSYASEADNGTGSAEPRNSGRLDNLYYGNGKIEEEKA